MTPAFAMGSNFASPPIPGNGTQDDCFDLLHRRRLDRNGHGDDLFPMLGEACFGSRHCFGDRIIRQGLTCNPSPRQWMQMTGSPMLEY